MTVDSAATRELLRRGDLRGLFNDLGWDHFRTNLTFSVDGTTYELRGLAEKRGVQVFQCVPALDGQIPQREIRTKIDTLLRQSAHEHLLIFTNADTTPTEHVWQWVEREPGKPRAIREHRYSVSQPGDSLLQKLEGIRFGLDEEAELSLAGDVIPRVRGSFGARSSPDACQLGDGGATREANADLIVRAVNEREGLLDALRILITEVHEANNDRKPLMQHGGLTGALSRAERVLREATETGPRP